MCIYSASERMRVNNFTFNAGQMFLFEWECAFTQFRCCDSISIYFWKCSLCLWYALIYLYICWLNECDVVAPHMRAFAGRKIWKKVRTIFGPSLWKWMFNLILQSSLRSMKRNSLHWKWECTYYSKEMERTNQDNKYAMCMLCIELLSLKS